MTKRTWDKGTIKTRLFVTEILVQIQDHTVIWRWISQKRYEIQTYLQQNINRNLSTENWTVRGLFQRYHITTLLIRLR